MKLSRKSLIVIGFPVTVISSVIFFLSVLPFGPDGVAGGVAGGVVADAGAIDPTATLEVIGVVFPEAAGEGATEPTATGEVGVAVAPAAGVVVFFFVFFLFVFFFDAGVETVLPESKNANVAEGAGIPLKLSGPDMNFP